MDKNTVVIDIKKYDEFKEFEKIVKNAKFICYDMFSFEYKGLSESELVDRLSSRVESLKREITRLKYPKEKTTTVEDIKQMGLFSLIKWRFNNSKK